MFKLIAGAFAGFAALVGGFVSGHQPPMGPHNDMATSSWQGGEREGNRPMPVLIGKVSVMSGTSLTVVGRASLTATASSTFSVDASSAKVFKGATTTMAVSDIKVGDLVAVAGTVSGSSVVATEIHDGVPALRILMEMRKIMDDGKKGPDFMMGSTTIHHGPIPQGGEMHGSTTMPHGYMPGPRAQVPVTDIGS